MSTSPEPVILITGAARRIGKACAQWFHQRGYRVAIHYHQSSDAANALAAELNAIRPGSAASFGADLANLSALRHLPAAIAAELGPLTALLNNASSFYPTAAAEASEQDWSALMDSNLKGPFFLTQACLPWLRESRGAVVNIVDIYADRPLPGHSIYCIAKAGLAMMTKVLAQELGPEIRVNGIAPGAILWPEVENDSLTEEREQLTRKVPLGRIGEPDDIARSAWFLVEEAPYISGQILAVDGGRTTQS